MKDREKTKEELIEELQEMRRRVRKREEEEVSGQTRSTSEYSDGFNIGADLTQSKHPEKGLHREMAAIEALLNATGDMVYLVDTEGTIIVANHRGAEFLGGSHHKLIGASIFDFFPAKLAAKRREKLDEVIRLGRPLIFEDKHYVSYFENSFYPILGAEGVQGIAIYSRDITNKKRTEKALEESKEKYKRLIEMMSEGLWVQNEDGVVSFVNDRLCEMLGYSAKEILGHRVAEFLDEPNLKKLEDRTDTTGQQGAPSCEIEWRGKDGRTVWTIMSPSLLYDADGVSLGSFAVITDITDRKKAEEASSRSERLLDSIIEQSPFPMWISDSEGTLLRINSACQKWTQLSEHEVVGKYNVLLDEAVEAQGLMPLVRSVFEEGKTVNFELVWESALLKHIEHEKTTKLILDVTIFPVKDSEGRVTNAVVQHVDISERKKAEEALRTSEAQLSNALEMARLGHWELDVLRNEFMFNDHFFKLFRTTAEQVGGYKMSPEDYARRFVHPDEISVVGDEIKKAIETDDPYFSRELEHRIVYADGDIGHISVRLFIVKDEQGRTVRTYGVNQDITERKKAQERLRESEERFRGVFENAAIGIDVVDSSGRFLRVNRSLAEMLGYTEDELLNLTIFDISHPDDVEVSRIKHEEMVHGETESYRFEKRYIRKSGEILWADVSVSPVRRPDGVYVATVGVIADITDRKQAEEDLKRMNERFSLAADAARLGVWDWDIEKNKLVWDDRMYALYGIKKEEFAGAYEAWLQGVHPDDRAVSDEMSKLARLGEREYDTEFRVVWPDGSIHHLKAYGQIVSDADGRPLRMTGINFDITERKQAETELHKTNDLLRAIIEAAPTAIIGLDLDGNVQLVWNPAAEKMLGWSAQEVMGRPLPIVPEEEHEEFMGRREMIRSGKTIDGVEVRRQKRDGTPIDYSIYASPLHDAEGRIIGNISVLVDMTDRKRAEQALRASEEKYRTLFEESIDGVYSVLRDGQITDANSSFCDIFGYTRQEMIGKNVLELYVDPADRKRLQKEIEKRGFVKDYEVKLRKRDRTELDCLLSSSVYFGADGSIAGYRGILRDLTLHKALQRQLLQAQKMESIGTLAGGIAHDFNNLLQVVIGYSDMLLFRKKPTDPDYGGLHAIRQAGRDGAELAKRILAFSRRLEPDTRPLNLNNEIVRVQKMLERTVSKMIRIEILLADNLMTVNVDPGQMEQILLNLAVNAQHAMPDGGRLTIETANVILDEHYSRTHLEAEPGEYVVLSVSDTGHGMEKEVLEHIFEPFYTTKEAGEGTGLGLAMVFGIVKSHKGHITCYSEPGAGTTFKIYFPAIVQEIEQDVSVTQQMPAFGTETILLVDDEKPIRKLGEQMLRMAGYRVLTATNGREALEIYRSKQDRIGLVLLDLMMPEMGGKQCLEELLKINPRVKVVIASGYSANGPTKDALASGAKRFVGKPYDIRQVLEVVRGVLDAE